MEKILSAIDIGTNSTRLLTLKLSDNGVYKVLTKGSTITRLGRNVDASGLLGHEQMVETAEVIANYVVEAKKNGSDYIAAIATSAVRDAANKEAFIDIVKEIAGIEIEIIAGAHEAALSYDGAMLGQKDIAGIVVFDIGGGSTEIIADKQNVVSLNVGAVRMTERFLQQEPPDVLSRQQVYQYVWTQLAAMSLAALKPTGAIGVGGTVTTYAAMALEMEIYDSSAVHGYKLDKKKLKQLVEQLSEMNKADRMLVKGLQPKRADIIIAGGIILSALLDYFELDSVMASETDILYGIINENISGNGGL